MSNLKQGLDDPFFVKAGAGVTVMDFFSEVHGENQLTP